MPKAPAFQTLPVSAWQNLNTPQMLWVGFFMICFLDFLLLIAAITGTRLHRDGIKVIGKDTGPSIIEAQHLKAALADMDANVANELLGKPGKMPDAVKAYRNRRAEAAKALVAAARDITFDEKEQVPIEAIEIKMGEYEELVQHARDLHEEDSPFQDTYHAASVVLDQELLTNANELDSVNHEILEHTYYAQSTKSTASIFFLILTAGSLLASLVIVQRLLNYRMRRILNPMLALATFVTFLFFLYTFHLFMAERQDLKVAKQDAFHSIHALWQARATAYQANADESRYLLDTGHAMQHEKDFGYRIERLGNFNWTSLQDIVAAYRDGRTVPEFRGYLADELNNITFSGEREAAINALTYLGEYLKIDRRIRELQAAGRQDEALELCIGTKAGQSNWAFDQFDRALGDALRINQQEFDDAVARGLNSTVNFEWTASIIALGIAALAYFGLSKRIQEYR